MDASLVVTKSSGIESERNSSENALSKSVNETLIHMQKGKVDIDIEDAVIKPVNAQEPFAKVKLTAQHNVFANEQQHFVQSEPIYDTSVGKENEKLHMENEHLKQTYKDLYDSIKKTRVQTKGHNDSLIAQINSKTVENVDLKAQIQEKLFANVALKNEIRKLKGNSVDTKFAKPSILGKSVLQPPRNQSVVRQPNAFKSERPDFSKPRSASQVDVNNIFSKPVTPHYLPKVRESVFVKPHHVIASGSSRNSSKESVQSPKIRNSNKPVEPKIHTLKPGRQIVTGHRFSPNKSFVVHEKTNTPRSCLRWIPTGRMFKTAGLSIRDSPVISNDVEEENHDLDVAHMNNDPFFGIPIPENNSEASSSSDVIPTIVGFGQKHL
ncbi:hypothetical protein Tco_0322079 [Tanacetum coccineum]